METTHPQQSEVKDERKTAFVQISHLPMFTRNNCHFYKRCFDGRAIQVCDLERHERISVSPEIVMDEGNEPCTESEFMDAYKRVSEILLGRAI